MSGAVPAPPSTAQPPGPAAVPEAVDHGSLHAVHRRQRQLLEEVALGMAAMLAASRDAHRFGPAARSLLMRPIGRIVAAIEAVTHQARALPDAPPPVAPRPAPGCSYSDAYRWVQNTYGYDAARVFQQTYFACGADVERTLDAFVNEPTPVQTGIDRDLHQLKQALREPPPALPATGGRIAVVGCSNGAEAFAWAAVAKSYGFEALQTVGLDINPDALASARDPATQYAVFRAQDVPPELLAHVDLDGTRLRPQAALRAGVAFEDLDILHHPLQKHGSFGIVALRNVLKHYPDPSRDAILWHTVSGLRLGGLLVLDSTSDMVVGPADAPRVLGTFGPVDPDYTLWRHRLAQPEGAARFGLEALGSPHSTRPASTFRKL